MAKVRVLVTITGEYEYEMPSWQMVEESIQANQAHLDRAISERLPDLVSFLDPDTVQVDLKEARGI